MPPTIFSYEMRGDPRRSFTIDSTTMHITCQDGCEYNTLSFWRGVNEGYVPMTKAEQESMDLRRIDYPTLDGRHFRFVVPINNENWCVYFERWTCASK